MEEAVRDLWSEVQKKISKEISRQNYETWLKPVKLNSIVGNGVTLDVPNKFFQQWILDHFMESLTRLLGEVLEKDEVTLAFRIMDVEQSEPQEPNTAPPVQPRAQVSKDRPKAAGGLNPKYTFSSFVVGPSNEFAHAAAMAVADNIGRAYNPFFVYGGVGLGKTHLLNAICCSVKERSPKAKIAFLTSEEFTNELITAIHYNRMTEFRNKYRSADVLVIDDVQFIAGKERTQEEFFHTFNTLHEDEKQIVMSSDRMPKDMRDLEERLRSRFEWGLIADIQPPDLETKAVIVQKKAESEGIPIPKDVAMFLATNIKSNVRELEGSLIRLGAYASLTGREVNMDLARDVLRDIITEKEKVMGLEQVVKLVSDHFQIKVSDIKSKRRTRNLVHPRQIAMYLCHRVVGASLPEVGRVLGGKDHTTVLHACRQVDEKRAADIKYDAVVESLAKTVKS